MAEYPFVVLNEKDIKRLSDADTEDEVVVEIRGTVESVVGGQYCITLHTGAVKKIVGENDPERDIRRIEKKIDEINNGTTTFAVGGF